ncbi:MAG: DMT family transporter [Bauldia sp.]|nr:DMT family transporter [Bauldia sp.]
MTQHSETSPAAPSAATGFALPFAALLLSALAMASSPLFVRLAEVGPFASAFWRVTAALPVLWVWAMRETRSRGEPAVTTYRIEPAILISGLVFAGDLLVWHVAILKTSVANASFFALMAPVWVVLGSAVLIGEKVGRGGVIGLLLCLVGAIALLGSSYSFAPEHLAGDLYAIATSIFFGAYFMAVRVARRRAGTGRIVFLTSVITAPILLAASLIAGNGLLPPSLGGAAALLTLSYFGHAGGQGFLAFALGHLPAAFSSLVTFLGSLAAAALAWIFLDEPLAPMQIAGAALILAGIYSARPARQP